MICSCRVGRHTPQRLLARSQRGDYSRGSPRKRDNEPEVSTSFRQPQGIVLITYADQRNSVRRYTLYQFLNRKHLTSCKEVDDKTASNSASGCCTRTTAILIIPFVLDWASNLALLALVVTAMTSWRWCYPLSCVYPVQCALFLSMSYDSHGTLDLGGSGAFPQRWIPFRVILTPVLTSRSLSISILSCVDSIDVPMRSSDPPLCRLAVRALQPRTPESRWNGRKQYVSLSYHATSERAMELETSAYGVEPRQCRYTLRPPLS